MGWLDANLSNNSKGATDTKWNNALATTLWFIWKWRCETIFQDTSQRPLRQVDQISLYIRYWEEANFANTMTQSRETIMVGWSLPPTNFVKVNVDGSYITAGRAASGGTIHDSNDIWILGFNKLIGSGSALSTVV